MKNEKSALLSGENKNYSANSTLQQPRRIPMSYSNQLLGNTSINDNVSANSYSASMNRYRYYFRLGMPTMPDHVVPRQFFVLIPMVSNKPGTQKSIITIFAIWNTMMGTSFLSMPWVFQQAGFVLGICLMFFVASVSFYTVYLVLKATDKVKYSNQKLIDPDFTDACRYYLGKPAELMAILFSFIGILGALIVYYVLLCSFLYSIVTYIFSYATNQIGYSNPVILYNRSLNDVVCNHMPSYPTHNTSSFNLYSTIYDSVTPPPSQYNTSTTIFLRMWKKTETVPFWILIIIFPLISIRSPEFFTKFNALGTFSILYLISLLILKLVKWGVHLDFTATDYPDIIPLAKTTFPVLTGVGMLAFFIHNAVHSIVRNQKNPENNIRDVFIAYVCVGITYTFSGIVFYIAFPFDKDCLQQNFLENLTNRDPFAFIARIALFVQMITVLPLLTYILRSQFMYFFFKKFYPSWLHVLILHVVLLVVCIAFAVFLPHIGQIIRFSGALCGLVYMITLPCLVKIQIIREESILSKRTLIGIVFHVILILLGVLNFFGQFLPFFIH